jgi:hypothetical protein
MSYDFKTLKTAKPREEDIEVPELADIWEGDGPPVWRIRSMSGDAIGFANLQASEEMQRRVKNLTEAIAAGAGLTDALMDMIGNSPDRVTPDAIRRTHYLVAGSVEPKMDFKTATQLRKTCYSAFVKITDRIIVLSGQGYDLGKSKPSGETPKSNAD